MNWTDFHFIRPYWLLLLMPWLTMLFFLVRRKLNQGNWTAVCDRELLPYLLQNKAVTQSRWPLFSGALAAFLAIIAAAGPTWQRLPTPVFRNESALVIALDLSGSMNAADLKPSRLSLARYKIADILKRRKDGQTALLVFAGDAFTVTPLTNDTQTIDSQLSALTTGIMPGDGDNLALALKKAEELQKQAGLQKGQILLITDGGDIEDGISQAKQLGAYQLLVLGAGTAEGAPVALETGGFQKDAQGGILVAKTDSAGLAKLAQAGNGAYHALTPDDTDLNALFSHFTAKLQQQGEPNDNVLLEQWNDTGPWLLLLVLPLAAVSFRKGLLVLALMILMPYPDTSYAFDMTWQDLWKTKNQQAQDAFNTQDYKKAAELFDNPEWRAAADYKAGAYDKAIASLKHGNTADKLYNRANALAQSGQLKDALDAYNQALTLNPKDEDTLYNKDLVEKALKKQEQEQQNNQNEQDQKNQSNDNNEQNKQPNTQHGGPQENSQKDEQKNQPSDQSGQPDQAEQKPERKAEDMPDKAKEEQQAKQPEPAKPEQTPPEQPDKKEDKANPANAAPLTEESKEQKQANEQWLKRIPDDPAGLLRRKFRYQYDRRYRQ